MLNDHVCKILGKWIRPKILQIEPLLVARSQAIGCAKVGIDCLPANGGFAAEECWSESRLAAAGATYVWWVSPG